MKIEIHLLQNFAPSCLNRDDTNTPKDCTFGDVRRARISSQCFKRAVREYWRGIGVPVGERTNILYAEVLRRIADAPSLTAGADNAAELLEAAATKLQIPGATLDKKLKEFITLHHTGFSADKGKESRTKVSLFLSGEEITTVTNLFQQEFLAKADDKTAMKNIKTKLEAANLSLDIALFGRMLAADNAILNEKMNTEAACQVAHALSTHATAVDLDYWTAVDDLNRFIEPGASNIGSQGFNSACYYRYALVDFDQLKTNLGGDFETAAQATEAFLNAAIHAIPTGKQNAMAAQNLPLFALVVVRDGGVPVSLANAFVKPVRASDKDLGSEDLVSASVSKLTGFYDRVKTVYGATGIRAEATFHLTDSGNLNGLADTGSVQAVVQAAIAALKDAPRA